MQLGCWNCANDSNGECAEHSEIVWPVMSNVTYPSWECCRCGVINAPLSAQCDCVGEKDG